jgi:predicted membrane channel-forming protein YqfA (hemolysin III family)
MVEYIFRNSLGKFILFSNLGFGILLVVLYFLKGFDDGEITELLKILTPIKAVYLTALIRYVIANKNISEAVEDDSKKITPLFARTSFAIIFVHITTLIVSTSLFALFNAMDFDVLINIIISVETFFGIYVGMFMASMFQVKEN